MAQFHYVVGYDSDEDKWFVEGDPYAYFADGNVFYMDRADSKEWGWNGWYTPDEGSHEEDIDEKCSRMLDYLVPIWPSPHENGKQ